MLETVNVIETIDNCVRGLWAYDNARDAEAHFVRLLVVLGVDAKLHDDYLDDGFYENNNYSICLVHSEGGE
jgi:hypothetical protein